MNSMMGVPFFDTVNPTVLIIVAIVVIAYYILFSSLGTNIQPIEPSSNIISMELLLWSVFILLLLLNGMSYLFKVDLTASIKNIFTPQPLVQVKMHNDVETIPEVKKNKEVFHIPGNNYGYEDAKALCKGYGSRLATYQEMSDAFDKGSDWCSYGWSDGQMALFPTQKQKWQNLQTIKGHEHDCGRPGINGGYIDNPNVHFGVNCYGDKPDIKPSDAAVMSEGNGHARTKRETEFDKRVDHWRNKIPEIIVAPFNGSEWSGS